MGIYLNNAKAYNLFREDASLLYYVDKTEIIKDLIPILESKYNPVPGMAGIPGKTQRYICITRPRRFGKTVMANTIAAFFGKGADSGEVFEHLKVSQYPWFRQHLNQHNVIHIVFNDIDEEYCQSYQQYIARIKSTLLDDLRYAYPNAAIGQNDTVISAFNKVFEYGGEEKFIFIFDEWDYIFHQSFATDKDKKSFAHFLNALLKDKPYVEMAYLTGVLPIAKYSSGSELNMFFEFSMASMEQFSEYFGFTDEEVDDLYRRYQAQNKNGSITRSDLELWYDGYQTASGKRLYNPRSVVGALSYNHLGSFWTSSGPYDEIYFYVKNDIDNIRNDIAAMMTGTPILANVQEYASTSTELKTKDEIYSAMVVYGFLSFYNGYISIPNKELMDQFADMVRQKPDFGYMYRLAIESGKMLTATKNGDTTTMTEILERVHNTESPLIRYNSEAELSKLITFVYLQAREYYDIRLEEHSGTGCVDYIFYPLKKADDCIIIELKVDDTAAAAIEQIKDRNYALNFDGKLGESPRYCGRILAVGIAYNRKDPHKKHECQVEVLREKRGKI